MDKEEIVKNNQLIIKFLKEQSGYLAPDPEKELFYHESWDWLMPVVKRCENLTEVIEKEYKEETFQFMYKEVYNLDHLLYGFVNNDIIRIYGIIIGFIRWYNDIEK